MKEEKRERRDGYRERKVELSDKDKIGREICKRRKEKKRGSQIIEMK